MVPHGVGQGDVMQRRVERQLQGVKLSSVVGGVLGVGKPKRLGNDAGRCTEAGHVETSLVVPDLFQQLYGAAAPVHLAA